MLAFPSQQSLTVMQVDRKAGNWMRGRVASQHQTDSILYWPNKCSGTPFTSEPVNRSQGGESRFDWCLALLDSVSFTRSLSIAMTSYKRHFCTLDCTGEPVGLYSILKLNGENITLTIPRGATSEFSLHSDKTQVKKGKKVQVEGRRENAPIRINNGNTLK